MPGRVSVSDLLSRLNPHKWPLLFILWDFHGLIALWQLFTLPSSSAGVILGLSSRRLLAGAFVLVWIILNTYLIGVAIRDKPTFLKWLDVIKNPKVLDALFIGALLLLFVGVEFKFLREFLGPQWITTYTAYIQRLEPLIDLIIYLAFEIIILFILYRLRQPPFLQWKWTLFGIRMSVVLICLGLVVVLISSTGLGIIQLYHGDWARGLPAVPLLEWQIMLAFLVCLVMILFESTRKLQRSSQFDVWLCLIIWLGTVLFWLSQTVSPNGSALKPHEPNFEVYPFTDAQTYDGFSQSVLVGNGFGEDRIPQRPLYILFLVVAHMIVGQNYDSMIVVQTLVLALFPVLLYLFGTEFFGRPLGVSIALLAVLRDHTSNMVAPFTDNISYSKLYLSEIPTAMLLILFLLIGLRWIKVGFPLFWGLILGGVLGTAMLIRTQVIVALPVLLIFGVLRSKSFIPWFKRLTVMLMGLALVVTPWLWRNWQVSGDFIFDSPESQTINLALRYSRLNGVEPYVMPYPGEDNATYNQRLQEMAWMAISSNPILALKAVLNSFLNHGVNNILLFPVREELQDPGELWLPKSAFWEKWDGTPTVSQWMLLTFYLFLFALGLATAWHRNGQLGLLPLGINLLYNLWTSLALLSGQRFMLTMDWSIYTYYMIGLFAILSFLMYVTQHGRDIILDWYQRESVGRLPDWAGLGHYVPVMILFLGIGLSLPLVERVFPKRYADVSQDFLLNDLSRSSAFQGSDVSMSCFKDAVMENQLEIMRGRAMYPRYYRAGDGESFTDSVGYKISGQSRLVFEMIGQLNRRVIFPMTDVPSFFPNAADVTLGIDQNGKEWFIFIQYEEMEQLYFSPFFESSLCVE